MLLFDDSPTETVKFTYRIMTSKNNYVKFRWQNCWKFSRKNNWNWANWTYGEIIYGVHIVGSSWLPYVTGYNLNDYDNRYDWNWNPINLIEVIYSFVTIKYRVSPVYENFYEY